MTEHLTDDILRGIGARLEPKLPLSVISKGGRIRVRRRWASGFSVARTDAQRLRGHVELCEGETVLGSGLVFSDTIGADEHCFEFKRFTPSRLVPPVDFERLPTAALRITDARAVHL